MRRIFLIGLFFLFFANLKAQVKLPVYPDSLFSTYYYQRCTLFQSLPQTQGDIVFIGNSITDGGEWSELFNDLRIKNRGISGDVSTGVIKRIDELANRKPAKVFLMIGVNDLGRGVSPDSLVQNILVIADYLYMQSPSSKLFVQSILPVNFLLGKFDGHTSKAVQIKQVNEILLKESLKHRYYFVNLYPSFCDKDGKLSTKFSNDGLHLTGEGYLLWKHLVFPLVYDLQEKPSLIPLPAALKWKKGCFPIYICKSILITNKTLGKEAEELKRIIRAMGRNVGIKEKVKYGEAYIELRISKAESTEQNEEGYKMNVTENKILITAATAHGIFNGIQTLRQLMRNDNMVDACEITDRPAFLWRGYMIDVGRNYMSMELLKQQIDNMSRYKLNIFHFHATEDVAWRIASKQYPQLTSPESMLRNKGMYYSEAEIKELIAYCRERYITFVPEIDMPGHSAAFKRAMKVDMQSDSGLVYVKNILKEFCTTYDVPYIHIGADEVKIINKNFIPEVTAYIQSFGKKVIGWQPGGNFSDNTIRQLWMDDLGKISSNNRIQYIDSRHLYLNHMDPLESVVTIFNRQIGNREKGDSNALGATICTWHDRAAGNETDILRMNPVYPAMLAFAERSWRGGGTIGWIANISNGDEKAFEEFETRLLDNKKQYFKEIFFPYSKQSGIKWKLYGPFDNNENFEMKFFPEIEKHKELTTQFYKQVTGGTIILRHWWSPLVKGVIDDAKENTTWYATTKIWSDEAVEKYFWIGFNNLSRSPATDSPPEGEWDNKKSAVWVNGNLITPPKWKRGGQKGLSEIPLTDEGYEYRQATMILLEKGWNTILIKMPVGKFAGKDWQNPVKWMFTMLKVEKF